MYDSKYDSKMHDITIPLMGFNGFHHASNNESKDDFEDFIGREGILDKLKSWIKDNNKKEERNYNYSGAYLVTGFRGMGKSTFVHKAINDIIDSQKQKVKGLYYVPICVNVGNDLLTSKELLYIICKLLSSKFEEKTRLKYNWRSRLNILIFQFVVMAIGLSLVFCLYDLFNEHIIKNISFCLLENKEKAEIFNKIGIVLTSLLLCSCAHYIYYMLWKVTGCSFWITDWQIKKVFKRLNERIDSEVTETTERSLDSDSEVSMLGLKKLGLKLSKSRKNVYPIAQTSEIQDLLVNQLRLIKKKYFSRFRFIFIIDELDKVSPEDEEKPIIPEYEHTNAVNGNSTYRSRQKVLSELLANMKYFISSSEAKFIFITGYDMYETTLSDISSREFNIHSIFNGYINVSSFLRKTGKNSGADSMIEEYLYHVLLKKNQKNEKEGRKDLDLGAYAHYFRKAWKENKDLSKKELKELEILLERRINFLRHFLTYLFYMSNGSPKKLAMYMEKYIRSKDRIIEKKDLKTDKRESVNEKPKDITLGIDDFWDDCKWFLYFDVRNIKKIEFINYLIYPMIKNLIAKSSVYGDKLLVSTSFMISNLYKFHKSGFSWRNLEYMPELLDINKTPELRDFIGGIMQFLNQTHIDEATINLYRFKFPQRLSEEITYFSKSSEEISFLFNFSHDELLSIKKLYHQQLEHYKGMKNESPAIASIHHTLGDIYMLEENYEQAIYEFNEALNAILRQNRLVPASSNDLTNILFRIRVSLKLALAYEKRKTFDTAFNTYQNIEMFILSLLETYHDHFSSQCVDASSFFSNVRITCLCILAKVAVIEKMGLGGISMKDLEESNNEFNSIMSCLKDRISPVLIIEFYKKLGDILYYKNGVFANERMNGDNRFSQVVETFRGQMSLEGYLKDKFDNCKKFIDDQKQPGKKTINPPCIACQCFNKSISCCIKELNGSLDGYNVESRSLFFIEMLFKVDGCQDVLRKGNVFMLTMANLLVGMGNTLLGCIKNDSSDMPIQYFFMKLEGFFRRGFADVSFDAIDALKNENVMNPYSKAILYYLAAAKTYELLTDYKLAYGVYVQILDAIFAYSCAVSNDIIDKYSLRFCEIITEQAITCTYLHYDCINCEEIETLKHEMAKERSENINLHSLSSFPEIEVVTEKYYHLCLLGKTDVRNRTLKKVINSRQLGQYKLIATLTQNIQNLYFKVAINDELLSRMIPKVTQAFSEYHHSLINTLEHVSEYYNKFNINEFINQFEWNILSKENNTKDGKMVVLNFLVNDTLFCLNKITELIAPLFSTTLYSNAYIGLIYEKIFNWSHLLITLKEISEYQGIQDKDEYFEKFKGRYPTQNDDYYQRLSKLFASFDNHTSKKSEESFQSAREIKFLTGSYLTGNVIDYFNRAVEMHTSGKSYKEMMPTLFFLEDDLNNNSNYLNLAIERFLLNHGFVQQKIDNLRKYSFAKSSLLRIDNYYKP